MNLSKEVVELYIEEIINKKNYNFLDRFVAPNAVWHGTTGEIEGRDAFFKLMSDSEGASAFDDSMFEVHDMLVEGNKVTTRFTHHAKSVGSFLGHPPTHKEVAWDGITIMLMEDNKVVEIWTCEDLFSLLIQLGIINAPE